MSELHTELNKYKRWTGTNKVQSKISFSRKEYKFMLNRAMVDGVVLVIMKEHVIWVEQGQVSILDQKAF